MMPLSDRAFLLKQHYRGFSGVRFLTPDQCLVSSADRQTSYHRPLNSVMMHRIQINTAHSATVSSRAHSLSLCVCVLGGGTIKMEFSNILGLACSNLRQNSHYE